MPGVDFSTQPDDTQTPRLPNGDFDHGAAGNIAREREKEKCYACPKVILTMGLLARE